MVEQPVGPGTVLAGRFRLEDLLEDTDGARLWRATDQTLMRNVMVHVISRADRRADALLAAARTSATVSDGHLLRVLDAAAEDGVVYVVNEWGSGVTLDRILEDGPLPPRRAAWVVKEVAETISTAHRHGIAHGRLLPENVMVTEAGSVKLIGFVIDAVLRGRGSIRTTGGEALGEHEADVVNLAGLLYAALVGRWPGTQGSTVPVAPTDHGHALRPRQVRAGIPRPLDAICDRVLSPTGHGQATPIETAHEIYAALSDYIGDPAAFAPEPTVVLGREPLRGSPAAGADEGPPTQLHPAPTNEPGNQPGNGHGSAPGNGSRDAGDREGAAPRDSAGPESSASDSEATQAGTPVFYDEDTGIGWTSDEPRTPPPPPPPELPEPEPKPLFAPGPPRAPYPPQAPHRSTGPGNGSLPPAWGPDDEPPRQPPWAAGDYAGDYADGESRDRRPGGSWLRLAGAFAALLVLVLAVVLAFNLGRGSNEPASGPGKGGTSSTKSSAPPRPVDIAHVSDFDPLADPPEENPKLAPLAVDGNPSTAWQTVTYKRRPDLGGLKSGVGLLLDLGDVHRVSKVHLTLIGDGTNLQLLAAPKGASTPTGLDGLTKVAGKDNAGTDVELSLSKPVSTRYLVVWLTSLPPAPGGFKGQIAEVKVLS